MKLTAVISSYDVPTRSHTEQIKKGSRVDSKLLNSNDSKN